MDTAIPSRDHLHLALQHAGVRWVPAAHSAAADTAARSKQAVKNPYKSVLDLCLQAARATGLRGWFQEISGPVARSAAASAGFLAAFSAASTALGATNSSSVPRTVAAGCVGGLGYWTVALPLDVIKSSLQHDAVSNGPRRYTSWAHCARFLLRRHGLKGFYRGYLPCIARTVPANALLFSVYQDFSSRAAAAANSPSTCTVTEDACQ